jgi:SWI/SNF-related matrix-associated actin-dependent regulator of chromatin subfamily A3
MTRYPGKRKSDAIDLTSTDDGSTRAPKASRTEPSSDSPQDVSSGMRFGESADYIPLPPLSQVAFVDEEEDQANELVQGSQDDASTGNVTLYGTYLSKYIYT